MTHYISRLIENFHYKIAKKIQINTLGKEESVKMIGKLFYPFLLVFVSFLKFYRF